MAYKPRIEVPHAYYHVVTRGNNKRRIFDDDFDRGMFLVILTSVARHYGWTLLAYCLMNNHYHVVLQLGPCERGLSRGMCVLNTGYAVEYNRRHGRINHLFGKRYWSAMLKTDDHLLRACRYVALNPVRAGLVDAPAEWIWSSYRATIGMALAIRCLATDALLAMFASERRAAVIAYEGFVTAAPEGPVPGQPP
jgi:REP element-mobilizing transposase RayT